MLNRNGTAYVESENRSVLRRVTLLEKHLSVWRGFSSDAVIWEEVHTGTHCHVTYPKNFSSSHGVPYIWNLSVFLCCDRWLTKKFESGGNAMIDGTKVRNVQYWIIK